MSRSTIERLVGEVLRIAETEENKARLRRWETSLIAPQAAMMGESYRGVPPYMQPKPPESARAAIPFVADFGWSAWIPFLGMSLADYYSDPETYVEAELRKKIFRFQNIDDDISLAPVINELPAFGPAIECSVFGMKAVFDGENTPWVFYDPLIVEESDLEKFPEVDFYTSGLMPRIHEWYREIRKLVGGDLHVRFPIWMTRCFGIAVQLRGFETLLMDFIDRPEFVHRLLRKIVEAQKSWERERARFLDIEIDEGYLHNDDIGCPTLSPSHYRQFVLPYEREMGSFYRRCYWHSCSDTVPLLEDIATIPNLQVFHVGPWTDRRKAAEVMCPRIGLDICLDPENLLRATEDEMRVELRELAEIGEEAPIFVRADCLYPKGEEQRKKALKQVQTWTRQARLVLQEERGGT